MRVLIQRVTEASVEIDGRMVAGIGAGMLLLVGIEEADGGNGRGELAGAPPPDQPSRSVSGGNSGGDDIEWLVGKIARLRIFDDAEGVMNLDVVQTRGEILAVSQFTLHASTRKGNRPSYIRAARPEIAEPVYRKFVSRLALELGREVKTGIFGADMKVALVNDGPVTILMDSRNKE